MSIYIQNMNMPKTATTLVVFPNGYVACYDVKDNFIAETRAIEVPPHGRLIDADALDMNCLHIRDDGMKIYTQRAIDNAPTIIPAEEGE